MTLQGVCGGITEVACESIAIQDEGVSLGSAFILNFTGAGVTATVAGDTATINVTGGGSGTGTVESVSVVSANGFFGSVASATTTPKITINVSALNAAKIANGSVSNTEFQYLDGVTSSIQTQFGTKQGNIQFQDEGIDIGTSGGISTINFTGAAVVASATGSVLTVRCSAAGGGSSGTVESVAVVTANGFRGTVASATTTAKITIDVSGLSTAKIAGGTFGRAFFAIGTTAAAVDFLGGGVVGEALFTATTTAAAQNTLGGGTVGKLVFATATTAAATGALGGTTVGTALFQAATTAAAQDTLGGGTFGKAFFSVATTAAAQAMLEGGTVGIQIFKTATTAAAQNALGGGAVGEALFSATTTAAAQGTLGGGTVGISIFQATTTAAVNAIIDASAKQNIIQYQDEGSNLSTAGGIVTVNFTGAAVVASATGSTLTVRCSATGGGGGTPGGADTYVQFNDAGSFGGVQDFIWNKTTQTFQVNDTSTAGTSTSTINPFSLYVTDPAGAGAISIVDGSGTEATLTVSGGLQPGGLVYVLNGTQDSYMHGGGVVTTIGGSTSHANAPVTANVNTTAVGNVGAGTDDLITYALPANALSADGKGIRITAWGQTANNANAKTLTLNWGSTVIFTRSMTTSVNNRWSLEAVVFRTGSNAQDYSVINANDGATNVSPTGGTSTQTDSGAITIKCTGNATSNNDVVQEGMLVEMIN